MAARRTADAHLRLGSDLRVAVGRIARRIKQLYEEGEVTFSETSVLSRLEREGQTTPTRLASAEHVTPQAIVAILNNLESRDLIRRSSDPSDGRRVLISMTESGRRVLSDKSWSVTQALAGALASGLSPGERQQLEAALPLLDRLADLM